MTTFNTGNPIGSTDARDLSDNAENFDTALGTIAPTWIDRFGVTRDSFEGRLAKGSFYLVGDFATGYTLTNMRQTLEHSGHEYSWSGAFPKVVAASSTPETTGGIGAGAWVDRTDLTLRSELLGNKSALVGPSGDYSDVQNALNLYNYVKLSGEIIQTTSSVLFDGFNRILNGGIDGSLCIGDRIYSNSGLAKTGNSTVSVIKEDLSTVDVDCILHTNYEMRTMPDGKHYYPSSSKIEDLTLIGLSGNSAGYCVGLASGININRMTITGCTDSFSFYDVFKSQISNINFDGQFRYRKGTTVTLTNATAYPNPDITTSAAFNIEKMVYSELHACSGDNLTVPTFRFRDCHGVTLTSCGCEKNYYEGDHGKFIYSGGYNELTIIDCTVHNNPTDTKANFRFTIGDKIRIIGGRSNLSLLESRTNPDIYIDGNHCTVDVFGHTFKDQTDPSADSIPSVTFAEGVTSSCVTVHLKNGRTVLITPSGVYDSNPTPFTPNINIDNSTFDFTVASATGTYSVNGKMVTVNGRIKLSANSVTAGSVAIGNLPISCSKDYYAAVSFYTEYTLCPIYARLNDGRLIAPVKETVNPTLIRENLAYTDLSDISEICFSVTYKGKHLDAF